MAINLSPTQDDLAKYIKNLESRLESLERARQIYKGDWIDLNVGDLSYNSNNVINTSLDLRNVIGIGDKIRINQSGYKYFYVVDIGSNFLRLSGGDMYTFTNVSFTTFSYSKIASPIGHPIRFSFNPIVKMEPSKGSTVLAMDSETNAQFSMIGNEVTIEFNLKNTTNTVPNIQYHLMTPFEKRTVTPGYIGNYQFCSEVQYVVAWDWYDSQMYSETQGRIIVTRPLYGEYENFWFIGIMKYIQ